MRIDFGSGRMGDERVDWRARRASEQMRNNSRLQRVIPFEGPDLRRRATVFYILHNAIN